jgi:putative transposase
MVIGDLSPKQMAIPWKEHESPNERNKQCIRNCMVYNDWGRYSFVQALVYKCLRFGKELSIIDKSDITRMYSVCMKKQDKPLWERASRRENGNCGLVTDREENSAVNIYQRFVVRLGPRR